MRYCCHLSLSVERKLYMSSSAALTVFYDGSCPLCVREISLYQRLTPRRPVVWIDVSVDMPAGTAGKLSQCDAMKRFHVMDADGALHSGAAAFTLLWKQYQWWRVMGHIFSLPILRHCAEGMYRLFLKVRPAVQQWVRKHSRPDDNG